jgi:hypothetical protein
VRSVPRSPCENSKRQNERYNDNDEPSTDRAFQILIIPHAVLHVSLVILISNCLGEQRQDAVGDVDGNDL